MIVDTHQINIKGIGASPGIAIGPAFVWKTKTQRPDKAAALIEKDDVESAVGRFQRAVIQAIDEVESLLRAGKGKFSDVERDILEMQVEMLSDPQLHTNVARKIREQLKDPVDAVWEVADEFIRTLADLGNEYLAARTSDVKACAEHIVRFLSCAERASEAVAAYSVIVADDITPLEALQMDLSQVAAIVTRVGGSTSHAAILARARNIPSVVGCGVAISLVASGTKLIVDGTSGEVICHPGESVIDLYASRQRAWDEEQSLLKVIAKHQSVTRDGVAVRLMANIAGPADMARAHELGVQGVGLFRTEWLFMNSDHYPTEEEQFEYYKSVVMQSRGLPVTLRTLDIGGDKPLNYSSLPREENPFLGYRAIRISLAEADRFKEQLRAILRISALGDVRIMFPMIGSLAELRQAKGLLREVMDDLSARNVPHNPGIPLGTMIETPAAALLADVLAKEVDFFSIGTNDLSQYTLAVDRGNERVKALYQPLHPSVLRLIQHTIREAEKRQIEVSLCGEMAADPRHAFLLVGLGLRCLSMSPSAILAVKDMIVNNTVALANTVAEHAMTLSEADAIETYLAEVLPKPKR